MIQNEVFYLVAGAVAGGFINGLSGTGTALFALGFFLLVLPPPTAVAIVALMAVLVGLQGLWVVRHTILARRDRLARFVLPGLAGVPLGLLLLDVIDAGTLRLAIGVFLLLYGAYFGLRAALPAFDRPTPLVDVAVAFIGGILGGLAGVSGALPTMWLSVRPWTKAEVRAVLQPYNATVLTTTITLLFLNGAYDATAVTALAIVLPVGLLAGQVGLMVFRRLSDTGFRRLLILLTFATGAGIVISAI